MRRDRPFRLPAAKFIDDVNDHRSNGYYETRPLARTADSKRKSVSAFVVSPLGGGSAGYFVPLTPEERASLQELLGRCRHLCHTRGLVVKQFLHDYDTNHLVTTARFEREAAALFPSLLPAERALLTKAYMTADRNDVRYMVLHNDVTPGEGGAGHAARLRAAATSPLPAPCLLPAAADDEASTTGVRGVMGKSGAVAAEMATQALSAKAAALAATAGPGGRPGPPSPVRMASPGAALEHAVVPTDNLTAVEASIVRQARGRERLLPASSSY